MRSSLALFVCCLFNFVCAAYAHATSLSLPVDDANINLTVTSGWYYGDGSLHHGIDYAGVRCVTPILAAADGEVIFTKKTNCVQGTHDFGCTIEIEHSDGYKTKYSHLCANSVTVNVGQSVYAGQVIAYMGNTGWAVSTTGGDGTHLDFRVAPNNCSDWDLNSACLVDPYKLYNLPAYYPDDGTSASCGTNYLWHECPPEPGTAIPTDAYNAIVDKANELWDIRPSNSGVTCDNNPSGLICHEKIPSGDMHWYGGVEHSYIIEDWDEGTWGWTAITYNNRGDNDGQAFVLRHGFWSYYRSFVDPEAPDVLGPPLGDEIDLTRLNEYTPYDPYCEEHYPNNPEGCVEAFCEGPSGTNRYFSSMQRFEFTTLCYFRGETTSVSDDYVCEVGLDCPCYDESPLLTDEDYIDPEDQYLFIDTDQNGVMDPCLRRGDLILCDENRDGDSDYAFSYGDGISATYFPLRFGVAVVYNYGTFYLDEDADGYTNRTITFGVSGDQGHYLGNGGALGIQRSTRYFLIDNNSDGYEEWYYPFGWGLSNQHYYLTDMNGDNLTDLVFREGNLFTVDISQDGSDDFYFTYGWGDADDYYFADLISDGTDEVIVRRGDTFYVLLNASISRTCPSCSNEHDFSFSYGNGL